MVKVKYETDLHRKKLKTVVFFVIQLFFNGFCIKSRTILTKSE